MRKFLTAGAVLLLLVAGCAKEEPGTPSAGARPTATTSVLAPTTTTPPATTEPPTEPTTGRPPTSAPVTNTVCTVRDLTVSLGAEEGTAGTVYRLLVFTNAGDRTCTIQGFPGVSFVAGEDGHQVGEPAIRDGAKGPVITLKPGDTASAPVGFRNITVFEPEVCVPTAARGLRVYPPHDRKSEFVPFETTGCASAVPGGQLVVLTVHAGSGL